MTAASAIGIFCFWRFYHPEALSFAEEMQMFLFSGGYLTERLSAPGGAAAYVGEFLTQFYNPLWLGAVIATAMLLAVQRLTWRLARGAGGSSGAAFSLSFVPAAGLLVIQGDDNVLAGYTVSILAGLVTCAAYCQVCAKRWLELLFLVIAIPLMFYLAGPGAYLLAAFALLRRGGDRGWGGKIICAAVIAAYVLLTVICAYRMSAYPLSRIAAGVYTYRMPDAPALLTLFILFVAAWPTCVGKTKAGADKWIWAVGVWATVALVGFVACQLSYDRLKYRVMRYDMYMRTHDWQGAVAQAKRHTPRTPLELAAVNYALAMRGELADRMFEFPQVSSEGLIPVFNREVMSSMMTSDIFFELGMVNSARRFAFEAQEAIPDQRKSGRLTKRLAEVAIVDGHYALAMRYLDLLAKTFAYGKWAEKTKELIKSDAQVDAHPLYRRLRRRRVKQDFFYSDREMDQMLGLLFNQDKGNRMALDYLLCLELVTRDMANFTRYIPLLGQRPGGAGIMPRHYQEALCMAWAKGHKSFDGMPWPVNASIKGQFVTFAQMMAAGSQPWAANDGYIGTSYWAFYANGDKREQQ